jgi:ribonuclease Z
VLKINALIAGIVTLCSVALTSVIAGAQEIRVTLLGTGTPVLNVDRFGMSTLIEAGNQKLIFDSGRGAVIRLHQANVTIREISAIFITHMHSDHIAGLPDIYANAPLVPGNQRRLPLEVWGPQGIGTVARGIEMMFTDNNRIRQAAGEMPVNMAVMSTHENPSDGDVIYEKDGLKVTAFLVEHGHAKPAYGYRVDYRGGAVVLSGDTTYASNLVQQTKGIDLLIHCLAIGSRRLEQAAPDFVKRYYDNLANPETAARVLNETRPRLAVFSHISLYSQGDIPRATVEELTSRVRAGYDGEFVIGQDLMSFTIGKNGVTREPYSPDIRHREPVRAAR